MTQPIPTPQAIDRELQDDDDAQLRIYARAAEEAAGKSWYSLTDGQRYGLRARNELARREQAAALAAKQQAEQDRVTARRDAEAAEAIEMFKRQARNGWIGDQASFDRAWPRLLEKWQVEHVLTHADDALASKRASGQYDL